MTYDFDTSIARLGTWSNKWDGAPGRFHTDNVRLPFSVADTDFACPPCVTEALRQRLEHPILGYSTAGDGYYEALCSWYARRHDIQLHREWLIPTTGIITGLAFALRAITKPGDRVAVFTPVYDPFFKIVDSAGCELVECLLECNEGRYSINFGLLEQEMKKGMKAVLFCSPHNPVGHVWSEPEMKRLAGLCIKYNVHLVSDEAHADYALFGNRHVSVTSLRELDGLSVTCIAANKTFNISGNGAAVLVIPNGNIKEQTIKNLEGVWIKTPTILGLVAATAGYNGADEWLDQQLKYLEGNSLFVQKYSAENMPQIKPAEHQGTFLMWLDCACFGMTMGELSFTLADKYGVGLPSGESYRGDGDRHLRLNIGCARSVLQQGLERVAAFYNDRFGA